MPAPICVCARRCVNGCGGRVKGEGVRVRSARGRVHANNQQPATSNPNRAAGQGPGGSGTGAWGVARGAGRVVTLPRRRGGAGSWARPSWARLPAARPRVPARRRGRWRAPGHRPWRPSEWPAWASWAADGRNSKTKSSWLYLSPPRSRAASVCRSPSVECPDHNQAADRLPEPSSRGVPTARRQPRRAAPRGGPRRAAPLGRRESGQSTAREDRRLGRALPTVCCP